MNILFDTNIVLDLVLDREPDVKYAEALFSLVEGKVITGFLCATTITTIHYLSRKTIGLQGTKKLVGKLLDLFEIAPVNDSVIKKALDSNWKDFEDAVLHQSALASKIDAIITRNIVDFKKSEIPIYLPKEILPTLSSSHAQ